jgi:MraZ protein
VLFTGEYQHTLDGKNRLSIPSRIRQGLSAETVGDRLYLIVGANLKLWLYPDLYYETLVNRQPAELIPDQTVLEFEQMTFGLAHLLDIDSSGRVLLPDTPVRRAGLTKDIVIIGVRDHLELWNRPEWEGYVENGLSQYSQTLNRARLARMSAGAAPSTRGM